MCSGVLRVYRVCYTTTWRVIFSFAALAAPFRSKRGSMSASYGLTPTTGRLSTRPVFSWTDVCALPGERQALCDQFALYKEGDT